MTDHPITPPPELVEDWIELAKPLPQRPPNPGELATQAARWGADQELEACCEFMQHEDFHGFARELRAARRPEPVSLKEQALAELQKVDMLWDTSEFGADTLSALDTIRRALEQLDD
jgi:hypothetical protein